MLQWHNGVSNILYRIRCPLNTFAPVYLSRLVYSTSTRTSISTNTNISSNCEIITQLPNKVTAINP